MTLRGADKAGVPLFAYGNFITVAINFVILAFIIFLMVKQINRLKREPPPPAPAAPPEDVRAAARDPRRAEEVSGPADRGVRARRAFGRILAAVPADVAS